MGNMETLVSWAKRNDIDAGRARRFARTGRLPDACFIDAIGTWLVAHDTDVPNALSAPVTRGGGTKRADGRTRFIVYVNDVELTAIRALLPPDAIANPRTRAKKRRDAKRATVTTDATDAITDALTDAITNVSTRDNASHVANADVIASASRGKMAK